MAYDLIIRNGTVVDGSGQPRFRADVGVVGDRIARIGRIDEKGVREIDAEGHVVSPGFIDGHTHMDAQVFWDREGSCSSWHGVTSVVMGNCGFTLAPSRPGEHKLVTDNLERAEDISAASMAAGIEWTWESFPEYLDAVEAQPKAINYASQIGHSALRTFAMGERAFTEQATEEDLKVMSQTLREAIRSGAFGFSTSVSDHHITPDDRPIASRLASWEEICRLVDVVGAEGGGIFQLALETELTEDPDIAVAKSFYDRLGDLAVSSRVPITYGLRREHLQTQLDTFDSAADRGGKIFGQSRSEDSGRVFSFKTKTPFDELDGWNSFRALPFEEQKVRLHDPKIRQGLVEAVNRAYADRSTTLISPVSMKLFSDIGPDESVDEAARRTGVTPIEFILDATLDSDFEQTFTRVVSESEEAALIAGMQHPRTIMTFSDSGAHVSYQSGADMQTILLSKWVREREVFTLEEAVRMISLAPALAWGVPGRGLLAEGRIADINIFDPETIRPGVPTLVNDLPAGAPRVIQPASGILGTIVSGEQVFENGEHTGVWSGRLIRRGTA